MKKHTAEREGISSLPAPILHHILSFLSLDESVQTCVLSKSWRHLGSTRPNFSLTECYFGEDKEKFMDVLDKSLQVYFDQKLCIEEFSVTCLSVVEPELVSLLKKWIPIVVHVFGVKKFHLSLGFRKPVVFNVPSAVFESESLKEINLERCNLSQINNIGNNNHLKTLILLNVGIEDESFAKFLSSCSSIECLFLRYCKGLGTINMSNYPNLKSFELLCNKNINNGIYFPSVVGYKYFPGGLTCLKLSYVALSNEWFDSLSRNNFPCLEELQLSLCNGFNELKLSSRSIKNLNVVMDKSTIKATIDAPSLKEFHYQAYISQSISFTTASSSEWNSDIHMSLNLDASLWFVKISELVAAISQSQINSLALFHSGEGNQPIEHLSDISVCCLSSYKMPVAIEILRLALQGLYYDSFYSDLVNGLFRIIRPREIENLWYVDAKADFSGKINKVAEFLCWSLEMGRWEDEGMRSFWQQDLEEVSLEVRHGGSPKEWQPVQGTISWSEYVATLLPLGDKISFCQLRFRLKWRPGIFFLNSFR